MELTEFEDTPVIDRPVIDELDIELEEARKVAGRCLDALQGDLSKEDITSCHNDYMNSLVWMTGAKRAEYEGLKKEQEEINKEKKKAKEKSKGKLDTKSKDKEKRGE